MRPIAEYENVDRERFEREIVPKGEPAVFRGLVSEWLAVRAASGGDEELAKFLRAAATDEPVETWFGQPEIDGRFGYSDDFAGFNHERKLATVDQLLDLLLRQKGNARPYSMYAGGIPVRRHLQGLLPAIPVPLLDTGKPTLISLWLGNRTRTAAHWDLPQNLACVVLGRRHFTLFPPDQIANLYVGPLDFTLAGQPTSLVHVDDPDLTRFPRFAQAIEVAQTAELDPGDALYLPSLWWHAVRGEDEVGAMVNYWWRDGPARMMTPLFSLLHALMTLHEMPANEKAAWKAMFDHYVFEAHGDPAAHLPETARGILGTHSPELIARLKERLARGLGK